MSKGTVNKVIVVGRLGQDPEIRYTQDGAAVATFSVATNESWKTKEGETQERTEWIKCTAFGPSVEKYIQPYIKKGTQVYVEGSLRTDKWQDKEGNDRYSTGVVVNNYGGLQIVGSGSSSGADVSPGMNQDSQSPNMEESQDYEDDNLPF